MKKVAALLALALAAAALVACGDDDGTTTTTETGGEATNGAAAGGAGATGEGGGGGSTVQFEADPAGGLAYTTDTASAKAGSVTIEFTNPQAVPHDVAIEDSGGAQVAKTDIVTESSATATADLKSGKYTFYCSVPGHREAGMEGALTAQ
jgi:plastocyanin